MRHLDLCSGIGGFALAARWMGWRTVGFAEIDPFASRVLAKNFPGVPNYGDIGAIPDGVGADIITAGIPCQPWSCAGKRMGYEDDRALWPIAREVIARVKPDWVVIENVAGFINMALDGVLSDLEAEGYERGTVVLPACAVNAPHRRDRVWVVANGRRINGDRRADLCARHGDADRKEREDREEGERVAVGCDSDAADPDREGLEGRHGAVVRQRADERSARESGSHAAYYDSDGRKFEPAICGDFDGLPAGLDGPDGSGPEYWDGDWERGIPRIAKGVPDRANRLKALGNAIVPQVAYQIFQSIAATAAGARQENGYKTL